MWLRTGLGRQPATSPAQHRPDSSLLWLGDELDASAQASLQ
jgi:hypothetical protein